ncbi:MAG: tRNA (guanosine(18)-2'-O)-methyltransferase TrmH [bacterium]|nr:tRNA (guanosine(18)-2'-O)-methyltransferase TrmH [bacterium]
MTPARHARLCAILDRRQPDLTVLMDDLRKPHNVSAVIRTCDAVGVHEIHAVSDAASFKTRRASGGGTGRYVGVRLHPTAEEAISELHNRGFRVLAAHMAPDARDFRTVDYTLPTAILLGTEKEGVGPQTEAGVDGSIVIPILGAVESLNVSVAAAVILYEAQRQRAAAGLYDQPHLDEETRQKLLFELGYRRLAERCRRKEIPYPRIGPAGEILDPIPRGRPGVE